MSKLSSGCAEILTLAVPTILVASAYILAVDRYEAWREEQWRSEDRRGASKPASANDFNRLIQHCGKAGETFLEERLRKLQHGEAQELISSCEAKQAQRGVSEERERAIAALKKDTTHP